MPAGSTAGISNVGSGDFRNNKITNLSNDNSNNHYHTFGNIYSEHITIVQHQHFGTPDFGAQSTTTPSRTGLEILLASSTLSALHDSAERSPAPRCYPGTRMEYLDAINDWMFDDGSEGKVMSLQGTIGAGKTAIAQTVAERCADLGLLAASFFFSRDSAERKTCNRSIATLVYQLCQNIPQISPFIQTTVERDPSILEKTVATQFQTLVVEPLLSMLSSPGDHDSLAGKLILIDGLDECEGDSNQKVLINLILQALEMHDNLPLRFLLISRPETHIQEAFSHPSAVKLVRKLMLQASEGALHDVRIYLRAGFTEIKHKHSQTVNFPENWPGDRAIEYLVKKSAGNFIYPSTALKFVDAECNDPMHQLEMLIGVEPERPKPTLIIDVDSIEDVDVDVDVDEPLPVFTIEPQAYLSDTDALYYVILSSANVTSLGKQIMGLVLVLPNSTAERMEAILDLEPGRIVAELRLLRSLIFVPEYRDRDVAFLHASFSSFLMDAKRAKEYHIDPSDVHADIVLGSLRLVDRNIASEDLFLSNDSNKALIFAQCLDSWMLHLFGVTPTPAFVDALTAYKLDEIIQYTEVYGQLDGATSKAVFFSRLDLMYIWTTIHRNKFTEDTHLELLRLCVFVFCNRPEVIDLSYTQLDTFGLLSAIHSSAVVWPPSPTVETLLSMDEMRITDLISPVKHLLINSFFPSSNNTNCLAELVFCKLTQKIDLPAIHARLAVICLNLLNEEAHTPTSTPGLGEMLTPQEYAKSYWAYHLDQASYNELLFDLLRSFTHQLKQHASPDQREKTVFWIMNRCPSEDSESVIKEWFEGLEDEA